MSKKKKPTSSCRYFYIMLFNDFLKIFICFFKTCGSKNSTHFNGCLQIKAL